MIPILYDSQEKSFTSNGIGRLYDAISCTVNEKRNGAFTLSLQYPRCGKYANELRIGRIIGAVHDSKRKLQAFDIVSVTRDTAGVIDVEAQHVSYRLKNVLTRMHMMSLAVSPAVYMNILNDDIQKELTAEDKFLSCKSDFRFHSDVDEAYVREFLEISSNITFTPPDMDLGDNIYDLLLSRDGIMSRKLVTDNTSTSVTGYGDCGDFLFDMYDVSFLKERGVDVGVKVRTGVNVKNITITEQDDKIQAVMPVWIGRDKYDGLRVSANLWESNKQGDALVYDSAFNGDYSYVRCQKLDLSSVFETKPTPAQLRAEAERYLKEHRIMTKNKHKTYSVDIVESDRDTALLQKSDLCDIVTVEDVDSRTREKLKIVEVTYDVLRDLYTHMVISKPDPTILELVDNRTKKIEEKVDKALTQVADVAQKTDVENEVYPTSYNPAHPESWTNPGGELTDAEGNKVEQVATINRRPVFVKKVGGSGGSSAPANSVLVQLVENFIVGDDKTGTASVIQMWFKHKDGKSGRNVLTDLYISEVGFDDGWIVVPKTEIEPSAGIGYLKFSATGHILLQSRVTGVKPTFDMIQFRGINIKVNGTVKKLIKNAKGDITRIVLSHLSINGEGFDNVYDDIEDIDSLLIAEMSKEITSLEFGQEIAFNVKPL